VQVTSGLQDGDVVITSGLQKIGDGAPVAPNTGAKPAAGAPATAH